MCRRKPEDPTAGITLSSSRDWEAVGQWKSSTPVFSRERVGVFFCSDARGEVEVC